MVFGILKDYGWIRHGFKGFCIVKSDADLMVLLPPIRCPINVDGHRASNEKKNLISGAHPFLPQAQALSVCAG